MIEGFGDDVVFLFGGTLTLSLVVAVVYSQFTRRGGAADETDPPNTTGAAPVVVRPTASFGADEAECSICMDTFGEATVTTNCGHNFDLSCFMDYCRHQANPTRVSCPTCRQAVSLLFPNFDASPDGIERSGDIDSFWQYNRVNGSVPRSLTEVIRDIPELLRQILLDTQLSRRLLTTAKLFKLGIVVFASFLYLLAPFDLIPESVFGVIGFMDDVLVVVICGVYITSIFRDVYVLRYSRP